MNDILSDFLLILWYCIVTNFLICNIIYSFIYVIAISMSICVNIIVFGINSTNTAVFSSIQIIIDINMIVIPFALMILFIDDDMIYSQPAVTCTYAMQGVT